MIYRQSRFPISHFLAFVSFVFLSSRAFSVEIPLEARSFTPVEGGGDIIDGTVLYVSSFSDLTYSASNASNVVIIEDMTSLTVDENDENDEDDNTNILVSNYTGYNTVTGEDQETGSLVFEVPSKSNTLFASSVKGFYRKTGPWKKRQTDQLFMFEGATGSLSYNSLEKARDVGIVINGTFDGANFTLFGDSTTTVLSSDYVSMGGWEADEGSTYDFSFISATLRRDGNSYTGFLRRGDVETPEDWESHYAVFRLFDTHDSDGDGVPDLSDLGSDQILGVLSTNSIDLGSDQFWSNDLNTTVSVDQKQFWLFGENLGWFYLPDQHDPYAIRIYIADERLGWLTTNAGMSPNYVRESDGVSIYFDRIDGKISFFDSKLEAWFVVTY